MEHDESIESKAQRERAHQTWELFVSEEPEKRVEAALRKVLRLKRFEVGAVAALLPGVVRRGAQEDLEPLAAGLREAGIACELRRRLQ